MRRVGASAFGRYRGKADVALTVADVTFSGRSGAPPPRVADNLQATQRTPESACSSIPTDITITPVVWGNVREGLRHATARTMIAKQNCAA
jgi:hypothetical protein